MRLDWPSALLLLVPVAAVVGFLLAIPVQRLLNRVVRRLVPGPDPVPDAHLVAAVRWPLALLLGAGASWLALEWMRTDKPVERVAGDLQQAVAIGRASCRERVLLGV